MEEKIIIDRKNDHVGKNILISSICFFGATFLITWYIVNVNEYWHTSMMDTLTSDKFFVIIGIALIPVAVALFLYFLFANNRLVVTNKRIYGKVAFGKRVDLPLDSISAVSMTVILLGGLSVSTSSGRITFFFIPGRAEVHAEISNLIINRQSDLHTTTIKQEMPQSGADELKKYKDLLDSGVITQEEFDAKKKSILGL